MFSELEKLQIRLSDFNKPWYVCGGWAVDLHLNRISREHSDLEFGIFREDQLHLRSQFKNWQFKYSVSGQNRLSDWGEETLSLPTHELYFSRGNIDLEVLLNERDENVWVYRRNSKVTLPIERSILYRHGIPYLAPEIVLLYKSRHIRKKDKFDFENINSTLSVCARKWLIESIKISEGVNHNWLKSLSGEVSQKYFQPE